MQVKNYPEAYNLKVIDPKTGAVGYYKGDYSTGVFLGPSKTNSNKLTPFETTAEQFLEWEVTEENTTLKKRYDCKSNT